MGTAAPGGKKSGRCCRNPAASLVTTSNQEVAMAKAKVAQTPSPPALVACFEAAITGFADVEQRKVFGYPAVCVNGNMVAGLMRDCMMLRLDAADRARFL